MIGIGVIGFGYWGPNLVRNFSETKDSRVTAVCDLSPERLAKVQRLYPSVQVTLNYTEMLSNPVVDAVVIATPVSSHYDLAVQALEAGKHVLVEKPLTDSVATGKKLIDLADKHNRILMVDHTFVYTGAVRKIKELIDDGSLGDLYYFDSVRINLGLFQHDVNVLWDLAVHDLSIMDFILNQRPYAVTATGMAHVPGQPENMAYLTCHFENNLIAHFHVNWLAPVKIRRTLIGGSQKMVVYDDLETFEKVKVYDRGVAMTNNPDQVYKMLVSYRTGDMWSPKLDTTEALSAEARHFIQCIQSGSTPCTNGEVGLRVVKILEAATASMKDLGRLVRIEG